MGDVIFNDVIVVKAFDDVVAVALKSEVISIHVVTDDESVIEINLRNARAIRVYCPLDELADTMLALISDMGWA